MADTGEDREIKERTDAREGEIVSEAKKLLQKSKTARDRALDKGRRGAKPRGTSQLR